MSSANLDRRYFNWLQDQVAYSRSRKGGRTHTRLLEQLHQTIFVAVVAFDENRAADARDLRYEYLSENGDEVGDPNWTRRPVTMLELLVVISRILSFEMDDPVGPWFWHLIEVLELEKYDDDNYDTHSQEVIEDVLDRVIWRTYEPDGRGGLFPLRSPRQDQREVELWYQLNAYLLEQF